MELPLLEIQGLSVSIGGKQVCRDLSLALCAGQRWGLLGVNGVGKTTLLHTLAGLRAPQQGEIRLNNQPISALPRRSVAKMLGLLLQDEVDPFPGTVLETVLMGRHPHLGHWQWESEQDIAIARGALQEVGLGNLESRQINTLSGGERRRLALATLLTQDPQLFLLDEPTNHLDPHHQIELLGLLSQRIFASENSIPHTLLMILHDVNLATRYCDHMILLFGEGEVLCGPVEEVLNADCLARLYGHPMMALAGPAGPVYLPI